MLVIQRRKGEGVRIGDAIFLKVLEIGRNRVKLGIEAPDHFGISRDELTAFDEQQAETQGG